MENLQKLADKVSSYKSYKQPVKDRVLKQFDNVQNLTDEQYKKALKILPEVMKANKVFISNYNNCFKQVQRLEIHSFVPELNALHFIGGNIIKTPQKATLKDAIEYIVYKGINFGEKRN